MIDFHTHILPAMDDGAADIDCSLEMLHRSFQQGVEVMVSTSHFYPDEEYPDQFLQRRQNRLEALHQAIALAGDPLPRIAAGAEVLYFPGISHAEGISALAIEESRCILIEPPMMRWTDTMLDEIANLKRTMRLTPVIAHVDRFMNYLGDNSLIERILEREMLVQVNASYFLDPKSSASAMRNLKLKKIHLVGSDCHNLTSRAPNLDAARQAAAANGLRSEFHALTQNAAQLLNLKGELL